MKNKPLDERVDELTKKGNSSKKKTIAGVLGAGLGIAAIAGILNYISPETNYNQSESSSGSSVAPRISSTYPQPQTTPKVQSPRPLLSKSKYEKEFETLQNEIRRDRTIELDYYEREFRDLVSTIIDESPTDQSELIKQIRNYSFTRKETVKGRYESVKVKEGYFEENKKGKKVVKYPTTLSDTLGTGYEIIAKGGAAVITFGAVTQDKQWKEPWVDRGGEIVVKKEKAELGKYHEPVFEEKWIKGGTKEFIYFPYLGAKFDKEEYDKREEAQ